MTAMMITSALLMAAAVIFRKTLGKKLNGRLLMLMWAIVFIKLAVPVSIPSDFSVMNLFSGNSDNAEYFNISHSENKSVSDISRSENAADSNSEQNNSEISAKSINTFPAAEISPEAAGSPKQKIDLGKTAYSIYSVIAAVLAIFVLTAYIICSVRFSRFEDMKISEKYPGLRFKKSTLGTPAVFGIFRPIILIPEDTDITDSIALGHIILHEKTHIRHHDQLFNMLTLMICCLNWYDPLAWVCRTLYLKDTEKWCDETVINIIGSENRQSYAKTLLACAEDRSRPFMLISGFGESDIKTRIKAILEDKKLRRGASLTAVILIIIIAAVLGTGKSVKAEMTFSDFVPTLNGWDYTQKFSGNNGETAAVTLNLNNDYGEYKPPNYFHFTIGIDSEEYSISEPHAKMRMTGVKSFRVVPDGERNDNESSVTYNADFNKASNDIELAVTFDRSAEPTLTADISYKLKKGIFTVGNYSMRVFYNRDMIYDRNVKSGYAGNIASINNQLNDHGFLAEIKENGYEISSIDGSTDLTIYFDDFDDGAVISDDSGRELKLDIFNPYYSMIESVDVTNDGVNDLVITEHITGTGVIQNYWKIIDGKNLCEIPVDTEGIEHIIIDFVNSGVFADFAAGTVPTYSGFDFPEGTGEIGTNKDDIFSETDPHLTGNLFWDEENENKSFLSDNIRIYGGLFVNTNDKEIRGNSLFGLVRNETEFTPVYNADIVFGYEDRALKAKYISFVNPKTENEEPAKLLSVCENYLTDYWSYITKTGDLDPKEYTSDEKTTELIEMSKSVFADIVSYDIDEIKAKIDDRNIEYGRADDITWIYIRSYTVNYIHNGEIIHTETGYNSYFEFKDTDDVPEMVCEIELWIWHNELGIDPEPYEFPLNIDVSEAVQKMYEAQPHSQDMDTVSEMGLPEVIYNCVLWDMVFCSDSYIDSEALANTIEIDGEPNYSEYRITDDTPQFIPKIEQALGTKLELSDGYYKCPFTTVEEVKNSAERLFSEKYIEKYNGFPHIKEYNGSLYAQFGGKGYPGGWIANAYIHEISDDTVDFTATFVDGTIGTYSVRYTFIRENGSMKLHKREF